MRSTDFTTVRAVEALMYFGFCCSSWRNASKVLAKLAMARQPATAALPVNE